MPRHRHSNNLFTFQIRTPNILFHRKNKVFKWDEMEALVLWLLVIRQKMSVTIASLQTQDSRRFGYWLAQEKMKLMWKQVRKQAGIINLFEIWLQLIYDFQFLHSNQIFVFCFFYHFILFNENAFRIFNCFPIGIISWDI